MLSILDLISYTCQSTASEFGEQYLTPPLAPLLPTACLPARQGQAGKGGVLPLSPSKGALSFLPSENDIFSFPPLSCLAACLSDRGRRGVLSFPPLRGVRGVLDIVSRL